MPAMATCAFIRSGFQWNTGRTLRSRLVCDRLSMVCSTAFSLIRKSEAGDAWNDKIGEIRRARYREGRSIKGISLGLGVSRAGGPEGFAVRRDGVRLRVPDAAASEDRFLAVGAGGDVVGERVPSEARANDADADFRGFAGSWLRGRRRRGSALCVAQGEGPKNWWAKRPGWASPASGAPDLAVCVDSPCRILREGAPLPSGSMRVCI